MTGNLVIATFAKTTKIETNNSCVSKKTLVIIHLLTDLSESMGVSLCVPSYLFAEYALIKIAASPVFVKRIGLIFSENILCIKLN